MLNEDIEEKPIISQPVWRLPATHRILALDIVWMVSDWQIALLDGVYMVASA